jgi:hypothetical protein
MRETIRGSRIDGREESDRGVTPHRPSGYFLKPIHLCHAHTGPIEKA